MVLTSETDAIYNFLVNNPDKDVRTIVNALRQEKKLVNHILYKRRDLFTSTISNSKHIKRPYWSLVRRETTGPSIITPRQPINSPILVSSHTGISLEHLESTNVEQRHPITSTTIPIVDIKTDNPVLILCYIIFDIIGNISLLMIFITLMKLFNNPLVKTTEL